MPNICKIIFTSALLELFAIRQVQAAEPSTEKVNIFPNAQEKFAKEWDRVVIEKYLRPCFISTSNTDFPSGYARLAIQSDKNEAIRLERSTFRGDLVSSCILSRGIEYRKSDTKSKDWTYIHLTAECKSKTDSMFFRPDNVDCKLTVFLNNVSETKELKDIIESHWKSGKVENPALYSTLQIINVLRMLNPH